MNSVHKDAQSENLLSLFKFINDWNMSKFTIRKNKATQWVNNNQQLTDFALKQHGKSVNEGFRRNVRFVQWDKYHCEVIDNVSKVSSIFSSVHVSIKTIDKRIGCKCKFMEETGMVCLHVAALMAHEEEIDLKETEWYEDRYHAQHDLNCYSVSLFSLAIDRRLIVSEKVPPEHKVTAGRPRSKC